MNRFANFQKTVNCFLFQLITGGAKEEGRVSKVPVDNRKETRDLRRWQKDCIESRITINRSLMEALQSGKISLALGTCWKRGLPTSGYSLRQWNKCAVASAGGLNKEGRLIC